MSKKQKKTLDELLEEALVPEDEQPYEIPGNWVWLTLNDFAECWDKYRKPINSTERAKRLGNIPYYGATGQAGWIDDYLTDEHLVVLGEDGAPFLDPFKSKSYLISGKAWVNNHAHLLKSQFGIVGNKYLNYYLNSFNYNGFVSGTTRLKLTQKKMMEIPIPLPTKNELESIANKIEILFAKLDEAKQLIEEAKETFEFRRAAILEKAFEGEFLSDGLKESMIKMKLEDVCISISDGDHQAPPKVEQGIPFLVISNINKGVLDFSSTRFVPEEYYEKINEKRKPMKGDVLYSVVGSYGIPALVEENKKFCFQRHIAILRPKTNLSSKFLYYVLQTRNVFNQATDVSTGTAQITVPLTGLRKIEIKVPPIEVQECIVNKVEELILKERLILDAYVSKIDIDMIKQSILSKAFKGELGTNDPTDEPAIELLKSVLQEKL